MNSSKAVYLNLLTNCLDFHKVAILAQHQLKNALQIEHYLLRGYYHLFCGVPRIFKLP